ncbi:MAG: membrane protein required for colicin V production [Chloroflexi bacterium]|jgi:membrane protein required for colicin V production|nr:MAG: membrane protein required for colicin V production [Chloroflexota bacterium]
MNWLDIVIIVFITVATFSGWRMGIIKGVATLVGMIAGVYLASVYHTQAADAVGAIVENETLATVLGYALIFVIIMMVAFAAGSVLKKMLSLVLLGWVDTLAGAGAGFLVAVIILLALLVPLRNSERLSIGSTIQNSSLASSITNAAPQVEALLPGGFDDLTKFLTEQLPTASDLLPTGTEQPPAGTEPPPTES